MRILKNHQLENHKAPFFVCWLKLFSLLTDIIIYI